MTRIETLRKLAEAATPGPWFIDGTEVRHDLSPSTTDEGIADCTVQICEVYRISEKLDHRRADLEKGPSE